MHRLGCALLLVTGCGQSTDDRPLELEYLTQAIFEPTCAAAQCHSSFRRAGNLMFDTPEHVRASLVDNRLVRYDVSDYDPEKPEAAPLIIWITELDPFGAGVGRMPFDAPMPNKDVLLLEEWIADPTYSRTGKGGLGIGAQCNPRRLVNPGLACNKNEIVTCTDDWNFGDFVQSCPRGCTLDAECRP
jgi:hypothetical protein